MSNTPWTQGPWNTRGNLWLEGADGEPIARVYLKPVRNLSKPIPREANARLIAAAPSLYTALATLVRRLEEGQTLSTVEAREALDSANPIGWTTGTQGDAH